jgi:hypothetical protein
MAYMVTASAVHEGQTSRPSVGIPLEGAGENGTQIITEPIDFWWITDSPLDSDAMILLMMKNVGSQNFPADTVVDASVGNGSFKQHQSSGLYKLDLKDPEKSNFAPGDYAVALYRKKDQSSWSLESDKTQFFKIEKIESRSKLRPPPMAVAVIAKAGSVTQLVGYGHLEKDDFSVIQPTVLPDPASSISWNRRAELSVLHRKFAQNPKTNSYHYDIVVTGSAGQTIPTADPAAKPQ